CVKYTLAAVYVAELLVPLPLSCDLALEPYGAQNHSLVGLYRYAPARNRYYGSRFGVRARILHAAAFQCDGYRWSLVFQRALRLYRGQSCPRVGTSLAMAARRNCQKIHSQSARCRVRFGCC